MIEPEKIFYVRQAVQAEALPLVFDSPHSGVAYPEDMNTVAPEAALKSGCDAWVDQLWGGVPRFGASLLAAHVHRTYIDLNRHRADIDSEMLDQPWPGQTRVSEAGTRGMGLIRRYALPGLPMYARKLAVSEVKHRIATYYDPYHAALKTLLDEAYARHGQVWHINCHSMKSVGNAMNADNGRARPDMVVSDCRGLSAGVEMTQMVADLLAQFGYGVSINSPYQGGDIVRKYGNPDRGRHSIQIEIRRSLYMNEQTFEQNAGFEELKTNLESFVSRLAAYVKTQAGKDLAGKTAL
jgi:N-formylglutamate deformylase